MLPIAGPHCKIVAAITKSRANLCQGKRGAGIIIENKGDYQRNYYLVAEITKSMITLCISWDN